MSHVTSIGGVGIDESLSIPVDRIRAIPADSPLHCADAAVEQQMIAAIDAAKEAGDTLGGAFEVVVTGLPVGLGSYVQWDRKLDGRLAQAIMSIPAIKAVGIGKGPDVARLPGSRIHDEIVPAGDRPSGHPAVGVARLTNNAGGLEGGVTNGEQLRVTGYMKPIATLMKPLRSVDLTTLAESPAAIERSDVCAVTAAAVVGEAMVALTVADAFLEKFGGDNLGDIAKFVETAGDSVRARFAARPDVRSPRVPDASAPHGPAHPQIRRPHSQRPAAAVDPITAEIDVVIDDMVETMHAAPGIGLAAPQIGVPLRMFIVDLSVGRRPRRPAGDHQPGIRRARGHAARRGRLPQPAGFTATVLRPKRAVVRALDREGRDSTVEGTGLLARALPARGRSSRRHALRRSPARHQAAA